MHLKKCLSVLTALTMLLMNAPVTAFAADTVPFTAVMAGAGNAEELYEIDTLDVIHGEVTMKPGEELSFRVKVRAAEGLKFNQPIAYRSSPGIPNYTFSGSKGDFNSDMTEVTFTFTLKAVGACNATIRIEIPAVLSVVDENGAQTNLGDIIVGRLSLHVTGEATEAATDPTEATTEPTEAVTEPTEAPTEPTEAPTEPTEAPTEPPTDPGFEPGVKPTWTVDPQEAYGDLIRSYRSFTSCHWVNTGTEHASGILNTNDLKKVSTFWTEYYSDWDSTNTGYFITDLNADNIPELAVCVMRSETMNFRYRHNMGEILGLYTYYDGKVVNLAATGGHCFINFKEGELVAIEDNEVVTAYVLKDGALVAAPELDEQAASIDKNNDHVDSFSNVTIDGVTYQLFSDHAAVVASSSDIPADVVLPQTVEGQPLTVIENEAFLGCGSLETIVIPEGVVRIGNSTDFDTDTPATGEPPFSLCANLRKVVLPATATQLGEGLFYACTSLEEINIPHGVDKLRDSDALLTYGWRSVGFFDGCSSLKNVTLPDSVSELGTYAFYNCGALETLTVLNDECKFAAASSVTSAADDLTPTEPFRFDGTILGHTGSTAEAFAKENGCQFKALDEEQPADPEELYKDILDYFRKNIAEEWANYGDVGNATYGIVNNDKTGLVSNLWLTTLRNEAYENVGYGFTDINGDGMQELLIGILYNDAEFGKADNAATIIDAYTYWEDKVIHLCSGGARVNYDLGQNGILEDAADGAVVQLTTRYKLENGALIPVECWKNDETNEEMPYAYSNTPVLLSDNGYVYFEFTDWTESTEENRLNNATKSFTIQPFDSKTDLKLGDVNGDSTINASDAALILIAAASIGATNESGLTYAQEQAANINGDNAINASDAAIILQYAASVGANAFTGTLEEYLLAKQAKG